MSSKRLVATLTGAVALLGVGTADAFAGVNAHEDFVRERAVPGSKIRIRISDLLENDDVSRPSTGLRFVRAFLTRKSDGIRRLRLSDNGRFLVVRLANDFRGRTRLKYEIRSVGRDLDRSRASVFIRARRASV